MLSDEQKAARLKGIGGSDAGVVAGVSPFKSPLALYYEKRGEAPVSDEETEAMEWGSLLEEPIAQKFAKVTGLKIRKQPLKIATKHPFMLASIDRQVLGETAILECKALNAFTRIETVADLPDYMYCQSQHYLEVYGYERFYFAILIGGQKFAHFTINRDQSTIDMLIEIEREFWRRVELGDPPPVDGSDATKELAKHLWPKDNGKVIGLASEDALATVRSLERAKKELKDAEDRKTAAENWIKFRMEDASLCRIKGFGEVTWKYARASKEEVCDLAKLKAEFPDAFKATVTEKDKGGGRRFLVKPSRELKCQD
jgi:putative phage-type endonuclease